MTRRSPLPFSRTARSWRRERPVLSQAEASTLVGGVYDFALARFNGNGTLDTSFGMSGKVTTDFAGGNDLPFSVAVQPDGNIVLAGGATINGRADFALV